MFNKKILLASHSPRRHYLLKQAGIDFRAVTAGVDETYNGKLPPEKFAVQLAVEKAQAVKHQARADEVILAADTIVVKAGKIYGKPADHHDAVRILNALSGVRHEVITGVCLLSAKKRSTFSEITKVYFKPLAPEHIAYYVNRFKPFDKAGAYAIQEWIGLVGIRRIDGCFFNVMGLPVSRVWEELQKF